jgi:hypothetical protein
MRTKKIYRIVAMYVALNLLAQFVCPVAAYALTNGPGQPEFQSFEPAGTTEMVNLFTGDFNYNIPLMTVPGPNGGYPINLAYHAGISMEQEASWVGLGWNINAGAINRAMRGLPDDFNGEQVKRELHYRPNRTANFFMSKLGETQYTEMLGFENGSLYLGPSVNMYYNNYRGLGFGYGIGMNHTQTAANNHSNHFAPALKMNISSTSDGIGVNVNISSFKAHELGPNASYGWGKSLGLSWGSRDGITNFSLGASLGATTEFSYAMSDRWSGSFSFSRGASGGVSFSKSAYLPQQSTEMTGEMTMLGISIGPDNNMNWKASSITSIEASYNESWVKYETQSNPAYGYMYSENSNAVSNENILEDLNREKDAPPTRQTKTLGMPVHTYDVYSVSGQGVGGVFRPYRSDVGIYTEPKIVSTIYGGHLNTEFGGPQFASNDIKWGADAAYSQSQTYTGMWYNHFFFANNSNQGWDAVKDYQFQQPSANGDLNGDYKYEPFYFKTSGEQTASPKNEIDYMGGTGAVRFELKEKFEGSNNELAVRPEIFSDALHFKNSAIVPLDLDNARNHRAERQKRIQGNHYLTNKEMNQMPSPRPAYIYSTINSFPATGGTGVFSAYSYQQNDQIGMFNQVNADGNRYEYAIPTKTKGNEDVVFSKKGSSYYSTDYISNYNSNLASLGNEEPGTDQFYSSSSVPEYADSYLLTAIFSPDYIDVTGNGPSEDDMGYYVKFNYIKTNSDFNWRAPYFGAILSNGNLSDKSDDKLSYSYGTKEIYYVHSIETKTHVACFILDSQNRKDGRAAVSRDVQNDQTGTTAVTGTSSLKRLSQISLYTKADPAYGTANAVPLKSVHFTYDYSLCPGVLNNAETWSNGADNGKLTLKSIYFTYLNNNKGQLSPYSFEYTDNSYDVSMINPEYDPQGNDRWGCYKKQISNSHYRNTENSYVDQTKANRHLVDQASAAWALKKINLPSGSSIKIEYESDDYAYVQDQEANQMFRVVGTSKTNTNSRNDISDKIGRTFQRLYFELNEPVTGQSAAEAVVKKCIDGIDQMYFKMFVRLKNQFNSSDEAYDYVNGYCKIQHDEGSYGVMNESSNTYHYGYVTVELVERDDYPNTPGLMHSNPIQKAAWQYIYLQRPDLFQSYDFEQATVGNLVSAATGMIQELPRAIAPYATADAKLWANKMDMNTTNLKDQIRPSYVRLNTPDGIKAGGGHRVKAITMNDEWNELSGNAGQDAEYGISYDYHLTDGRSSGVAAYEPMIGGDEIALRKPIRYNSDALVKKDEAFYVEEPLGESYYPAPIVGYSRVVVKSIVGDADNTNPENRNKDAAGNLITESRTGQTVYEFYTAKDYPVKVDNTDLQKTAFPIPVVIPKIGSILYNNRGYSQGYAVELNDMHGKIKRVATYPYDANLSRDPMAVRSVFYKYNGEFSENPSRQNVLNSTVNVLTADGQYEEKNLGLTYDFYNDMRQHSNETFSLGIQYNTNTNTTNGFTLPTLLPLINISKSLFRSVVTMKVIYRTGILTEVETLDDGATSKAKNVLFDGETGSPLLTTVTNEFDKPVYTYNYAAHWDYKTMGGAYHNIGVRYNATSTNGSGQLTNIANAENVFCKGDEVLYMPSSGTGQLLWVNGVSSVSGGTVTFMNDAGANPGALSGDFVIVRSGYRNQQVATKGTIVSLTNPLENRKFPLFTTLTSMNDVNANTNYTFADCATGETITFSISASTQNNSMSISKQNPNGCEIQIKFDAPFVFTGVNQFDGGWTWKKQGSRVIVTGPSNAIVTGTWIDPNHCFNECLDNVLHAASVRFVDNWQMNFDDVGLSVANVHNKYKYAEEGVWRMESNYLYQVDRKQTNDANAGTNISKDGTYLNFVLYDWNAQADQNEKWSYVSTMSRYSPYGYALETRDALGIYSASMYGYGNTKQTASVANGQYFEMGFDAFEDYGSSYPQMISSNPFGHGHLLFTASQGNAPVLSSTYSHTGKYSLSVMPNNDAQYVFSNVNGTYDANQKYFEPQPGAAYNLSAWVRATKGDVPMIEVNNGSVTQQFTPNITDNAIEGWYRIDFKFIAPSTGGTLTIKLKCIGTGSAWFDDVRVQPFTSAMASYVYDPQTHWVLAELDNRNFATFYNYDEEGTLVQVKQETEKGVFTVSTARGNLKK